MTARSVDPNSSSVLGSGTVAPGSTATLSMKPMSAVGPEKNSARMMSDSAPASTESIWPWVAVVVLVPSKRSYPALMSNGTL